ncbi:energy transducer TonB [Novosphingobium sp. 9U]|uniref:energy transducer TonB family protein n=1 Tax=Novosphingobium sp. 9U TaxID=2653158 RepID=UPI00135B461B|nr:energy transducer TonB [Novosphingobium sp. 9U]
MKRNLEAAGAAAFFICAYAAHAEAPLSGAAMQTSPSLANWSARVITDLNKGLRVRDDLGSLGPSQGIVAVKFNCSESGAPADVKLLKSSGNREYDFATIRAVRRIASLHPLPLGLRHDQKYVVRMLFANSESGARQKIAEMRREADHSNAWYAKTGTNTAALELVPAS